MKARVVRRLNEFASSSSDEESEEMPSCVSAPTVSHASGDFHFFDDVPDNQPGHGGGGPLRGNGHAGIRGPDATRRVGRGLLAGMQVSGGKREREECGLNVNYTSSRSAARESTSSLKTKNNVASYAPLTSGGFMDASAEHGNVHNIKVGDVVSLRHSKNTNNNNNNDSNNSKSTKCKQSAESQATTTHASPVTCSTERTGLTRFRKESDLNADERRYGKAVTYAMLHELGEVTRLDKRAQVVEVSHLDGTRRKHSLYDIRPAGYVEQALYEQWKRDAHSRPVQVLYAQAAPASSVSAPTPAEQSTSNHSPNTNYNVVSNATTAISNSSDNCITTASLSAPPGLWWVIPRLVVRIIDTHAVDWYNKCCVVRSVRRKERAIRLAEYRLDACGLDELDEPRRHDILLADKTVAHGREVEMVGQEGLATVVPSVGQMGLVVRGRHRGEQAKVVSREWGTRWPVGVSELGVGDDAEREGRGCEGAEEALVCVTLCRTGETIRLSADEVCVVARS